jgi:hypothetical protein
VHSLSIADLDCASLDLALNLCAGSEDLARLRVPAPALDWIPPAVSRRAWLHRAAHARAPQALALGDRLDLRAADFVAWARDAQPLVLRDATARAARGAPQPALLWTLLTDPRPYVQDLGRALGRAWVLSACAASARAAQGADAQS